MKDLFPEYYSLTEDQYRELWEKCTFILFAGYEISTIHYIRELC
jgi:hypothetical protein